MGQHAHAGEVTVELDRTESALRLRIRDDGAGFVAPTRGAGTHYGLVGMQERAHTIGATLDVDSTPGHGTTVQILVPAATLASP